MFTAAVVPPAFIVPTYLSLPLPEEDDEELVRLAFPEEDVWFPPAIGVYDVDEDEIKEYVIKKIESL